MPQIAPLVRFHAVLAVLICLGACATTGPPPPAATAQSTACYPLAYRKERRQIRFDVVVDVDPSGQGRIATLPEGLSEEWGAAAACVVAKLRFQPATRNGEPVASRLTVPITFSLKN